MESLGLHSSPLPEERRLLVTIFFQNCTNATGSAHEVCNCFTNVFVGDAVGNHERADRWSLGLLDDHHCDSLMTAL